MINTIQDKSRTNRINPLPMELDNTNCSSNIETMVINASKFIQPVWPIETFIACNPLHGFESLVFEEAIAEANRLNINNHTDAKLNDVNREMIKWCATFLDEGQAAIAMPGRSDKFYNTFRVLCIDDKRLHLSIKNNIDWLKNLPEKACDAICLCLNTLKVPFIKQEAFIQELLNYLPGWSGYIKWHSSWKNDFHSINKKQVNLIDFIAIRLVITTLLWPDAWLKKSNYIANSKQNTVIKKILALETQYSESLLKKILSRRIEKETTAKTRPDAQFIFCIDIRSEPLRHCLETIGDYETFGFAGFFGLPVRHHDYNRGIVRDCCPVLLKPHYDIHEIPSIQPLSCVQRNRHTKEKINQLKQVYQDLKYSFSTAFPLAETIGAWCGMSMLLKTLAPVFSGQLLNWITEKIMPTIETQPVITRNKNDSLSGIDPKEQVFYAESVLKTMGLTDNFAKVVILCGHGSTTQNNPYASALDCGACGGNHGGSNAKILAAILNRPFVRASLYERGIIIPADTQFEAAQHDTTTDEVVIYSENNKSKIHSNLIEKIKIDLTLAQKMNSENRCKTLVNNHHKNSLYLIKKRSQDWSQTRPEWGLARNAAFIIGPRRLTKSIDLQGRCFLHSYEWNQDENSTALETIMTAPMVVAQWINTQYLFSTIDNISYGSGSKITHNLTSKIGVMQGNASDLMHGLPLQSVMKTDETLYHEPQRLLTVIYAPRQKIDPIIQRQDILKTLFFNGWVRLIAIEPELQAYELDKQGQWHLISIEEPSKYLL